MATKRTIITIQHTQSQHHVNGMIGAWADWELTELGRLQAANIGRKLAAEIGASSCIMFVSDLKRAYQTAEKINDSLKLQPVVTPSIREVNAGEGNGQVGEWYRANAANKADEYNPDYRPFPSAESDRDLWNRLQPFYQQIMNINDMTIIVVSHGTALSFLHAMIIGDKFSDVQKRFICGRAGAVSRFNIEESGRVLIEYTGNRSYIV